MKSSHHVTRIAAALLVSVGGLAAVQSAGAAPAYDPIRAGIVRTQFAPQAAPAIERFVVRAPEGFRAGDTLRYRLVGTPNSQAWVDIAGVGASLAMSEVRPGVYEAQYQIRGRDNRNAFDDAVAHLQRGPQRVNARVDVRGPWDGDVRVGRHDNVAPQVSDLAVRDTERGFTRIVARVNDQGSGVDWNSVQLRIDGRDQRVRIEGNEVHAREGLGRGRHFAELTVRDNAGNQTRRTMSFFVG